MPAEAKKKRSTSKKGESENGKTTRPARGGLAQTVKPDAQLAAVVGGGEMTRAEITKAIWEYVKENKLQDDQDRRKINADAKLKPVFGGKDQVTMFEMTKLVNQHVS
jgi:upstream activation factor subunit UAF30